MQTSIVGGGIGLSRSLTATAQDVPPGGRTTNRREADVRNTIAALSLRIQQTERELQPLATLVPPLLQEVQEWINSLAALTEEAPPNPPTKKPPLGSVQKIQFRPPKAYVSDKTETVTLVMQNGRVRVIDFAAINSAIQKRRAEIVSEFNSGTQTSWNETTPVPTGSFNIKENASASGTTLSLRNFQLTFKEGQAGETLSEAKNPDSVIHTKISKANPDTTTIQCAVFPDSFDAFRDIRQMAWDRKFQVGWTPFSPGQPIYVGSGEHVVDSGG